MKIIPNVSNEETSFLSTKEIVINFRLLGSNFHFQAFDVVKHTSRYIHEVPVGILCVKHLRIRCPNLFSFVCHILFDILFYGMQSVIFTYNTCNVIAFFCVCHVASGISHSQSS